MAPSPMAEKADCSGRRRFAVACSVLSQCVRAAETAAGPVVQAQRQAPSPMLLMPGADVVSQDQDQETVTPMPAQLTIVYGRRVLVFDHVRADTAAEVMRVAARQDDDDNMPNNLQVARNAALQRVVDKRRNRLLTHAPYAPCPRATGGAQGAAGKTHGFGWLSGYPRIRATAHAASAVGSTSLP